MDNKHSRNLAFIDVDGTLTLGLAAWEKIHHFFGVQEKAKKHTDAFFRGEIDYDQWAQLDTSLWLGRTREDIKKALLPPELRPGVKEGIELLHEYGFYVVLLSGGIDIHVNEIKRLVKADDAISNELVFGENDQLVGVKSIVGMNKEVNAKNFMREHNITPDHCIAIGDSINDISLFQCCHWSLAIHPTHDEVKEIATFIFEGDNFYDAVKEFLLVIKDKSKKKMNNRHK